MKKLILLLLFNSALFGEIYIFSYKITIKNNQVIKERLFISPIMLKMRFRSISFIEIDSNYNDSNREIIKNHKGEILAFLFKYGVYIDNQTEVTSINGESITILTLKSLYISIDRTKNFTLITLLERI